MQPLSERHAGTALAVAALALASQLPLTSSGIGSSTPATDAIALASGSTSGLLRWASVALVAAFCSGALLGASLLVPGRASRSLWWVASLALAGTGLAVLAYGRSSTGSSVHAVAAAGLVLCGSGWLERRRLRRSTHPPTANDPRERHQTGDQ